MSLSIFNHYAFFLNAFIFYVCFKGLSTLHISEHLYRLAYAPSALNTGDKCQKRFSKYSKTNFFPASFFHSGKKQDLQQFFIKNLAN